MAAAARTASDTAVPATKRAEVRCPKLDRSAMARSDLLSESAINRALSMEHLILTGLDCPGLSLAIQYFVPQRPPSPRDPDHEKWCARLFEPCSFPLCPSKPARCPRFAPVLWALTWERSRSQRVDHID